MMEPVQMILRLIALFLPLLLLGCAAVPGNIQTHKSLFDNADELSMTPAWVLDGMKGFRIGLSHTSRMPANELTLTAMVNGAVNIADGDSIKFNIDGEVVAFKPFDALTTHASGPGSLESSRRYVVTLDFLRRIISATNCTARLDLYQGYLEGRFSTDAPTTARPAFRRFLSTLEAKKP
jgi:hypothetical protein